MALQGPQKTVVQLVGVVVLMGGLSWASVPFYDWFCRVTGFGGCVRGTGWTPERERCGLVRNHKFPRPGEEKHPAVAESNGGDGLRCPDWAGHCQSPGVPVCRSSQASLSREARARAGGQKYHPTSKCIG